MNPDEILEQVSSDCFWLPDHVEVIERPAIKYTRSSNPSSIYNRVLWVRPEDADPAELVDEVLAAHEGRRSRWMLSSPSDTPQLRQLLLDAGYTAGNLHHAYSIATNDYDRTPPQLGVLDVQTVAQLRDLYTVNADAFEQSFDHSDERLEQELAFCTGPDRRVARLVAYRNGEPAGSGGMTLFDDESFALIWAGGVRKAHRGHGVYTALLAERARIARQRGIARMGLYARVDTSAPIVAAHGFERHGHMLYFERGAD